MTRRMRENGVSISEIAREMGCSRKTARKYIYGTKPVRYKRRRKKESILDPYKDHIRKRLGLYPLSAVRLFEEIQEMGYTGSYTTVKNFVRTIKRSEGVVAEYSYETGPGIQSQVDWGVVDRVIVDGVKKKLYCFVMVLGYSRTRYTEFTLDCRTDTFIQCHLNAFAYFGGVTKEILYDNTKNVVLHRALKSSDSEWNRLFEDFFSYYGFLPRLCKPGKEGAKTKGKVERAIGYVKNNLYLGLEYDSIADLNNKARLWMERVNRKPHGTTGIPPLERLLEEKLDPFDLKTPYQIVRTEYRKITKNCYFKYMGNSYSVPWKYAGCQAELRIQNSKIMVFVNGTNVCQHIHRDGSGQTVRVSEHFDGLLKLKMGHNRERHEERLRKIKSSAPSVSRRPLVEYEIFTGCEEDE